MNDQITPLDYFAGLAMQELMRQNPKPMGIGSDHDEWIGRMAYYMAQAMMKAREHQK